MGLPSYRRTAVDDLYPACGDRIQLADCLITSYST